jgi:hypothetical protein
VKAGMLAAEVGRGVVKRRDGVEVHLTSVVDIRYLASIWRVSVSLTLSPDVITPNYSYLLT